MLNRPNSFNKKKATFSLANSFIIIFILWKNAENIRLKKRSMHFIKYRERHCHKQNRISKPNPLWKSWAPLSTLHQMNTKSISRRKSSLRKVAGYLSITGITSAHKSFDITSLITKLNWCNLLSLLPVPGIVFGWATRIVQQNSH